MSFFVNQPVYSSFSVRYEKTTSNVHICIAQYAQKTCIIVVVCALFCKVSITLSITVRDADIYAFYNFVWC